MFSRGIEKQQRAVMGESFRNILQEIAFSKNLTHIETSQLIGSLYQVTGFYQTGKLVLKVSAGVQIKLLI